MSLISKENMRYILDSTMASVNSKIYNLDITEEQKEILNKSDLLKKETEGYSVLCDDGTYKDIYIDKIEETEEKTNEVTELFDVNVNDQEEKWETKLDMPTGRYRLASSIYQDKIYCIGGTNGTNKNECYNVSTNTWETKLNMPTDRYGLVSETYEDNIYVIGGRVSNSTNKNECYNISTNTWETKLNMPTSRYYLSSSIYEDKIYCIGGYGGTNKNECYNVSTNTWETKLNMPTDRYFLTSSIYKDKIYCIAGTGGTNKNECYNISTNTWETKLDIPKGRYGLTSSIHENKIYVIGGNNGSDSRITTNECYNISTNTWETKLDMPTGRHSLTSSIYEDKIYVIGGNGGTIKNECYYIENLRSSYNISLPDNLGDKLESITIDGDGSKVLSDDGTYIDIPKGYRFLTDEEVNELIDGVINYQWNGEV